MGRKLISPPPSLLSPPSPPLYFSSLINDSQTVLVNHDCKTSCGLIRDVSFTNRLFGEVSFKKEVVGLTQSSELGNTKTGFYQLYDLLIKFDYSV